MENKINLINPKYQPIDWNFSNYSDPDLAQTMRIAAADIIEGDDPYDSLESGEDWDRISKIDWDKIEGDSPIEKAEKAYHYYRSLKPNEEFNEGDCNKHQPGRNEDGEKSDFEEEWSKKDWPQVKDWLKGKKDKVKELLSVLNGIPAIAGTAVVEFVESATPTRLTSLGRAEEIEQYFDNIELNGKLAKIDILTNNYDVVKYYKKKLHRKKVFLLVDWSGSMASSMAELVATLEFYLRQLERGEIDSLYMGKFLHKLMNFEEITDTTKFRRDFTCPGGGSTYIQYVIPEFLTKIASITGFSNEIVIINDGDDDMDSSYSSPIKTHCIALDKTNADVKTVCLRSGGKYINLTEL